MRLNRFMIRPLVEQGLREELNAGDTTGGFLVWDDDPVQTGQIYAKGNGVACGLLFADETIKLIDPGTLVVKLKRGTSGVTLVVDGKEQPGRGPTWELALEPGEHKVSLAGAKVQSPVQIVVIESGKPTPIELGIAATVIKRWPPSTNTTKPTGSSQDDFIPPKKKP